LIKHEDVKAAAGRIAGKVVRTPVVYSDAISRLVEADVWLKLDTLQVTGAFAGGTRALGDDLAFDAMLTMHKIDVAKIEAAVRGA
jgi:threonine dehydratase